MKEYVKTEEIRETVIREIAGVGMDEIRKYSAIIEMMREKIRESLADETSRDIINMPPVLMHKLAAAVCADSQRGLMAERYYTHRLKLTKANIEGAGDYYDSNGGRGEMKFSSVASSDGRWHFMGVRPGDSVDNYVFVGLSADGLSADFYKVPHADVLSLPLHESTNIDGAYMLVVTPTSRSKSYKAMQKFRWDLSFDNHAYFGQRLNANAFLVNNGVSEADLDAILSISSHVRDSLRGFNRPSHMTYSELASLKAFIGASHYGLIMQSWVADRMNSTQSANHRAAGDIINPQGKRVEVKISSGRPIHHDGVRHTWQGIAPNKFDELILIALHEDHMEYFVMTSRQFKRTFASVSHQTKSGSTPVYRTDVSNLLTSTREGTVAWKLRRPAYNRDLNLNG